MKAFEKCPVCGGELIEKEVEKLLRGGSDVAVLRVKADICLHCGERLFSEETVQKFEQIRNDLTHHRIESFEPLGNAYKAA
ncbi:MAG: YgiT-type zinc finger protein [Chitinivibrionales bacterium]|nr:YgiT-type zinc finger protein [Chitinivibrionales bacterium]